MSTVKSQHEEDKEKKRLASEIRAKREHELEESPYIFPLVKETDPKNYKVHGNVDYALKKWAKAAGLIIRNC